MTDKTHDNTKEKPIRRLIRRKDSQEYFTGNGWTNNPEEARTFADSLEAAQTCAHRGLVGVEVALRVTGGTSDLFCTALC